ncbi:hypothetical protein AGR5A_pb0140 [Agrobacterium genomosp. 5 str. CFBP 6626]|nr:hypothetical protein AGR5A_pb0140 [Agrobacterium genomosp. 5 str. CFBP 6626]
MILECIEKGRCALAPGEKMHGKHIRIGLSTECYELTAKPCPKQREQSAGVWLRWMVQLRKLASQSPDRASIQFDLIPIHNQDIDEAANPFYRCLALYLPSLKHSIAISEAFLNYRFENVVLRFEMVIEVAARNLHQLGNVREGRVIKSSAIEQIVRYADDLLTRSPIGHRSNSLLVFGRPRQQRPLRP